MPQCDGFNCWPDILPPVTVAPLAGIVNSVLGFTVSTNPLVSSTQLLGSLDLEIRTAPNGGGTAVYTSLNNLAVLGVTVPAGLVSGLQTGQTYYIRTRFKSLTGMYSDYSADVVVTT